MGVGRASEHETFWRATYLRRRSIDADRAPPTRRRPVRVRRRRSQRRTKRGERSEGGGMGRRVNESPRRRMAREPPNAHREPRGDSLTLVLTSASSTSAEKQPSGLVLDIFQVPRGTVWRSRSAREAARATPQLAAAPVPPFASEEGARATWSRVPNSDHSRR